MLRAMLNGEVISSDNLSLHSDDRGLLYGDGLFETMLFRDGAVRFLDDHLQRLQQSCQRLQLAAPDEQLLRQELQSLIQQQAEGVIKLIMTRGRGGRGYRPVQSQLTRVWQLFAMPALSSEGITARWCEMRLSRNRVLAGMKHLNRLEQVIAQSEWSDANIAEGLMLDTEGELVCGTMSNVFLVIDNVLVTPDLRFSGVTGVMRKNVLRMATQLNLNIELRSVHPEELADASEIFVTNAVRGIQPITELVIANSPSMRWPVGPNAQQLTQRLAGC